MDRIATIGFFDGVHSGHRYLFERLRSEAEARGLQPLIVTFDCHPRSVLQSDYVPQLLTTLEERKALLEPFGEVVVLSFEQVQPLTAAQFMALLHKRYQVSVLLMGYDHRFGSDRLHAPADYRRTGEKTGVEVITTGAFQDGEWHVSSTEIRSALSNGNIALANELLGRPYSLCGTVIHGKGIGRRLGFPTANIQPDDRCQIIPKSGVYAALVNTPTMDNAPAFVNIGTNPTVAGLTDSGVDAPVSIEVHIPSFKGDLYDQRLELRFMQYLREEKRFESVEALRDQIKADVDSILRRE